MPPATAPITDNANSDATSTTASSSSSTTTATTIAPPSGTVPAQTDKMTKKRRKSRKSKRGRKAIVAEAPTLEGLGGTVGWIARGDREPVEKRVPFTKPKLKQIANALPFIWRYSFFWLKNFRKREKLFINTYQPLKHRPYYGVPCGGIGAGSIGRDFRGAFCKFSLRPGIVEQRVDAVKADQFILNLSRNGVTLKQIVLSAAFDNGESPLAAWDFGFPAENVAYRGLYPRAWTRYDVPEYNLHIVCRQITPIIPHDYKDSSLPATAFIFDVTKDGDEPIDVSITFAFRNGTGKRRYNDPNSACETAEFTRGDAHGAHLTHTIGDVDCTYSIAAREDESTKASVCTGFDANGNGRAFWNGLTENAGVIEGEIESANGSTLNAVSVSLRKTAEPKAPTSLEFSLVWHMPTVYFGTKLRPLNRWYTRHFGTGPETAEIISEHVLNSHAEWDQKIDAWQNPVLEHPCLPDWFKSALFNELYFLSDGGSLWFDYDDSWQGQEKQLSEYTMKLLREYGRFGYLESWEYRMINTYDVHFYASFALAELFPQLEHVLQAEMSDNIHNYEEKLVKFHMEGDIAPRKTVCRVPHDLGNPAVDPWLSTNAYAMHNTAMWKDLNLKFVLATYRDYLMFGKSAAFLEFAWKGVKSLIEEGLVHWDRDGDGMIENFGQADQTYDAWRMVGVTAYCGSLWLAALRVAVAMAADVGDEVTSNRYSTILDNAKRVFEERLWNGKYYNFDESSTSRKTIMADQLCGYWYLQSISPEMADDILPADHVQSSLSTVYEYNVMKFGNCRVGAVNGMKPNGKVDASYIQADEVWTGITYALGAFLIQQGQPQRGFDVAWGVYDTCFNRSGLQYQTPEAIYRKHYYRAIGYMRPLSIWSMYSALRKNYKLLEPESHTLLADIRVSDPVVSNVLPTGSSSEDISSDGEPTITPVPVIRTKEAEMIPLDPVQAAAKVVPPIVCNS